MPDANLANQRRKNYLYMVNALPGATIFKHLYVVDNRTAQELDVLQNGRLSCAYVVSCVLTLHYLLDRPHATVTTTVKKMLEAGWRQAGTPVPGAIVRWPSAEEHGHIGFYVADNVCVSNSTEEGVPLKHGLELRDGRTPDAFYTHDVLLVE